MFDFENFKEFMLGEFQISSIFCKIFSNANPQRENQTLKCFPPIKWGFWTTISNRNL